MAFSDLISGALATLRGVAGVTVTYTRGVHSVDVTATLGASRIEMTSGDGSFTVVPARDYMIAVEDLILNSVAVTPSPGDTIEEDCEGKTYVYRVMDLGSEQCYQFSDFGRTQFRIHTKQISVT